MNWLPNLSVENTIWAISSPLLYGFVCTKVNRAPLLPILIAAFSVGFLTSYIAYLTEASLALSGFSVGHSQTWIGFTAFVALPEEAVKLAALIGLTHNHNFRTRAALIIGSFIGCGFAASENLIYLVRFGSDVISARFLTATAFHVFNAILMGRLLVSKSIKDDSLRIVLSLILPVLLHGTYDALVVRGAQGGGQFVFVLGFAVAAGFVTLRGHPMDASAENAAKLRTL